MICIRSIRLWMLCSMHVNVLAQRARFACCLPPYMARMHATPPPLLLAAQTDLTAGA